MCELREWTKVNQRKWVAFQTYMASKGKVLTRTGHIIPTFMAFRCLYCGEYFNQSEAEEHFGKTRKEYGYERKRDIDFVEWEGVKVTPKAYSIFLKEQQILTNKGLTQNAPNSKDVSK